MLRRALLVALLIYVPNQLHFPGDLGLKGLNVLNILMLAAFAGTVPLMLRRREPAPLRLRFAFFFLMLTVAYFVGQAHPDARAVEDLVAQGVPEARSVDDLTALKTAITYMLLYFVFFHAVQDQKTVRLCVATLLLVVFVASLEVIKEALGYGILRYVETHRASGPFGQTYRNANRAGVFFAMFVPLFMTLLLFFRSGLPGRLVGLAGTVVGVLAVFWTYSRQAYAILAVAFLLLLARRNPLLGALAILSLGSYQLWLPASVVERIQMTTSGEEFQEPVDLEALAAGGEGLEGLEVSARMRPILWAGAIAMFADHPFGVGLGRFTDEIGNYCIFERMDAHNSYLRILAETGWQGLTGMLLIVLGLLGLGVRLLWGARDESDRLFGIGYSVCVVAMALSNVYGSPFFYGPVMGNFWALSGIVARYRALRLTRASEEPEPADQALVA
jgi:O-antigen ligase